MHRLELVLAPLADVAVLAESARRHSVPDPIFLVLGRLGFRQIPASLDPADKDHDHIEAHRLLQREAIRAAWMALMALRDWGESGDETLHRIERELDLEEGRVKL